MEMRSAILLKALQKIEGDHNVVGIGALVMYSRIEVISRIFLQFVAVSCRPALSIVRVVEDAPPLRRRQGWFHERDQELTLTSKCVAVQGQQSRRQPL